MREKKERCDGMDLGFLYIQLLRFYEFDKGRMANLLNGVVVNAQRVFKKKKKRKPHVSYYRLCRRRVNRMDVVRYNRSS